MPRYSSNKSSWPTKNLFMGGGLSRPFHRIGLAAPKQNFSVGPTIRASKKLPRYVGDDRVLTVPKRNKVAQFLDYFLEQPKGITPVQPNKKRRSMYDPKNTESQQ